MQYLRTGTLAAFAALLVVACPSEEEDEDPCAFEEEGAVHPELGVPGFVGLPERPAEVIVPFDYDGRTALPVVFLLHGFGVTADLQDFLFKFTDRVDVDKFILVKPNGTQDANGNTHWNATDACCDFTGMEVDDVGYLTGLLDELEANFRVDSAKVYFSGHSNGGFMSYRMACEIPERVAAILPVAGATWLDDADCGASESVAVLHAHGDGDQSIEYEGNENRPGAVESVTTWAARSGCDLDAAVDGESIDLLNSIDGAETSVRNWVEGCGCGLDTTLWTIEGTGHVPPFTDAFAEQGLAWLFEHRKF